MTVSLILILLLVALVLITFVWGWKTISELYESIASLGTNESLFSEDRHRHDADATGARPRRKPPRT